MHVIPRTRTKFGERVAFVCLVRLPGRDFLLTYIIPLTQNSSRNTSRQYYLIALIVSILLLCLVIVWRSWMFRRAGLTNTTLIDWLIDWLIDCFSLHILHYYVYCSFLSLRFWVTNWALHAKSTWLEVSSFFALWNVNSSVSVFRICQREQLSEARRAEYIRV